MYMYIKIYKNKKNYMYSKYAKNANLQLVLLENHAFIIIYVSNAKGFL